MKMATCEIILLEKLIFEITIILSFLQHMKTYFTS